MGQRLHEPGTFCWHEMGTKDTSRAKGFLTELFGWSATDVPMPSSGDCEGGAYTLLRIGDKDVAGLYAMSGPHFEGVPPHWMSYVAVESCDETARKARDAGATVMAEPMDIPGVGRIACLSDPTGAAFGLFQPGDHPGAAVLEPVPGNFCWNELMTTDPKAATGFYAKVFGWTAKAQQMGPLEYTMWMNGGSTAGGMMGMPAEMAGVPSHWMPYVSIAACDATSAKAERLGAKTLNPPMDVPGVGRMSTIQDPTGAHLSFIQLSQG